MSKHKKKYNLDAHEKYKRDCLYRDLNKVLDVYYSDVSKLSKYHVLSKLRYEYR